MTSTFGDHLQNECTGVDGQEWSNIQDQTIPKSLTVEQNTQTGGAAVKHLLADARGLILVLVSLWAIV